jgi:hypothetical protein
MRRFLRENSLSLVFLLLFLAAFVGQSVAGWKDFNEKQAEHGGAAVSYGGYLLSPDFGSALLENWQSEYLQFALFIYLTIWLVQKGSNESKPLEHAGRESPQKQRLGGYAPPDAPRWARTGGLRTALYSNSLMLVMVAIFLGSWAGHALTAWREFNESQLEHGEARIAFVEYVRGPEFWEQTLQNWQSEFLAVGSMAVFTIFLRQRGSPESKPVGSPHHETAASG